MPQADCGFSDGPVGRGADLLTSLGPTLIVNIGFDPSYDTTTTLPPVFPDSKTYALVDTGATESHIDTRLATNLGLPIVDRRKIGTGSGPHETNVYLAQIHVPSLQHTVYGEFAGADLAAAGFVQQAVLGRTFLLRFTMTYNGATGKVVLERP